MKKRNPIFFLEDIQLSVNKILNYTENMSVK